jgi:hypothetical protein
MFTPDVGDFRRQIIMAASSKYEWLHMKFSADPRPRTAIKQSRQRFRREQRLA